MDLAVLNNFCELDGPSVLFCTQATPLPTSPKGTGVDGSGRRDTHLPGTPGLDGETPTKRRCDYCCAVPFTTPLLSRDDTPPGREYISSQIPRVSEYSRIRNLCLRSLSCEAHVDGLVLFGDSLNGYALAYLFKLHDLKARGHFRSFSFMVLSQDHALLVAAWSHLQLHFKLLALELQNRALARYKIEAREHARTEGSQHHPSGMMMGRQSRFNQQNVLRRLQHGQTRLRPLSVLLSAENLFQKLHVQFCYILKSVQSLFVLTPALEPPITDQEATAALAAVCAWPKDRKEGDRGEGDLAEVTAITDLDVSTITAVGVGVGVGEGTGMEEVLQVHEGTDHRSHHHRSPQSGTDTDSDSEPLDSGTLVRYTPSKNDSNMYATVAVHTPPSTAREGSKQSPMLLSAQFAALEAMCDDDDALSIFTYSPSSVISPQRPSVLQPSPSPYHYATQPAEALDNGSRARAGSATESSAGHGTGGRGGRGGVHRHGDGGDGAGSGSGISGGDPHGNGVVLPSSLPPGAAYRFTSLEAFFTLFTMPALHCLLYNLVIGNQVIVRSLSPVTVGSALRLVQGLLPSSMVSSVEWSTGYRERYECNFLGLPLSCKIPPHVPSSSYVLVDIIPKGARTVAPSKGSGGNLSRKAQAKRTVAAVLSNFFINAEGSRKETALGHALETLLTRSCPESIKHLSLTQLKVEWLNKAKLLYAATHVHTEGTKQDVIVNQLLKVLSCHKADLPALRFWQTGLPRVVKEQVRRGALSARLAHK